MNYHAHNDAKGLDARLRAQAWNASRAQVLAAFRDRDFGAITLCMSKRDLQATLARANYIGSK